MAARLKVGVLVSGRGSNLQALIDACAAPAFPAKIALVISNVANAYALERAARARIPGMLIGHRDFADRAAFDAALDAALRGAEIDLVCLAGFMRLLTAEFVQGWAGRMINVHPSLLPAFRGLDTHRRALAAGVKLHGCSVHFVTPGLDEGPIIAQAAVPVLADDDESSLAARVLEQEHRLYPLALRLLAEGQVTLDGEIAKVKAAAPATALLNPSA